nr:retrotransposon Gag domain, retroviral aspartyl protease [Tanacetum cinerariifolium]
MVQTRNSENNNPPDPIATQLAALAAKLEAIETMKEDIATLKEGSRSRGSKNFEGESSWMGREQYRPYKYNKIDFPIFSGGDPRGSTHNFISDVLVNELKLTTQPLAPFGVQIGSTHNFISDVLVNELKLTTQPLAPFGVQIGNGDVIRCGQICKHLHVQINDLKIT